MNNKNVYVVMLFGLDDTQPLVYNNEKDYEEACRIIEEIQDGSDCGYLDDTSLQEVLDTLEEKNLMGLNVERNQGYSVEAY